MFYLFCFYFFQKQYLSCFVQIFRCFCVCLRNNATSNLFLYQGHLFYTFSRQWQIISVRDNSSRPHSLPLLIAVLICATPCGTNYPFHKIRRCNILNFRHNIFYFHLFLREYPPVCVKPLVMRCHLLFLIRLLRVHRFLATIS